MLLTTSWFPHLLFVPTDVFIVDLACNIYFMSDAAYKQLQPTTNWNRTCSPHFLARLAVQGTETCTGISPGLKSNVSKAKCAVHDCLGHDWDALGAARVVHPTPDLGQTVACSTSHNIQAVQLHGMQEVNIDKHAALINQEFTTDQVEYVCCLQLILLSTNEGYVVQLEVNRKPTGSYEQKEVSRVLAAADPMTGMLGTEGGEWCVFPTNFFTKCLARAWQKQLWSMPCMRRCVMESAQLLDATEAIGVISSYWLLNAARGG